MKNIFLLSLSFWIACTSAIAQHKIPTLFIDCQMPCHLNYIKEQITFVNYMQNRQEADIYILATRQQTGAGGSEVQLVFSGEDSFVGLQDTIVYQVDPNATEAIQRDQLVSQLKRGLLTYIIETDLIQRISYTIDVKNQDDTQDTDQTDPWNYWVFNVGGNGWVNGEESYSRVDLSGRISANRITEQNKFQISAYYNLDKSKFTLSDGETLATTLKSYNIYAEYVKSISSHWSIGGTSRSGSSTFGNTDVQTSVKAAVEYNFFPYSEAQTQRFSFFYAIGPEYYDYTDETIYDKNQEWVLRHGLIIDFQQTQKWGQISVSIGVQQYFHNLDLYNAYFNPYFEWQIFKGLSINFGGHFSFVTDRINIAKSDISDEDIILKIKQLDTSFSYYSHFGINYRFGSRYNNFVNPRF